MDLKDIKAIIDLMKKNSIAEFEMEKEGFRLRLKRAVPAGEAAIEEPRYLIGAEETQSGAIPPPAKPGTGTRPAAAGGDTVGTAPAEVEIRSPIVGTFYRAPAPDAPPYVEVGSEVNPDTVVCIIEAMKVMNEIKAEVRGVITEVLVENGMPVEYGQPLFRVRPTA